MQRTANPRTSVRFRPGPPLASPKSTPHSAHRIPAFTETTTSEWTRRRECNGRAYESLCRAVVASVGFGQMGLLGVTRVRDADALLRLLIVLAKPPQAIRTLHGLDRAGGSRLGRGQLFRARVCRSGWGLDPRKVVRRAAATHSWNCNLEIRGRLRVDEMQKGRCGGLNDMTIRYEIRTDGTRRNRDHDRGYHAEGNNCARELHWNLLGL
jgi:hypothetical protein